MKPPVRDYRASIGPMENALLDQTLSASAIGTVNEVRDQIGAFLTRTQADELVFTASIFDQDARKHSLTLASEAMAALHSAAA